MNQELIQLLQLLVKTPSVNPMGKPVEENYPFESPLTAVLETSFSNLNLECQRIPAERHRNNLVVLIQGQHRRKEDPLLLVDCHQDTVPAQGMRIPPFEGKVEAGRLYGRGACDVKGAMAALLWAVQQIISSAERPPYDVLLLFTVNEEHGFTGIQALCKELFARRNLQKRKAAAIVLEPTELNVVYAHKGVVRWQCRTLGRSVHSSTPHLGSNAIYAMAHVVVLLEKYAQQLQQSSHLRTTCGTPTLSVGTIQGGTSVNVVPAECTIEIDRRIVPGETPETARKELIEYLEQSLGTSFPIRHDAPFMAAPPLVSSNNRWWATHVLELVRTLKPDAELTTVPYATDGGFISQYGIPTIVFGPGSIAQAHTDDEWIELPQVELAAEIFKRLLTTPFFE